jgi:predicted dehydrogenase
VDDDFTIEDTTCTNIRFAKGASGSHIHSWSVPRGMNDLTITGADFSLSLRAHSPPKVSGKMGGFKETPDSVNEIFPQGPPMGRGGKIADERGPDDPPDPPHCGSLGAFLQAVRTGDKSLIRSPYRDAVRSLATVLAMNRSIDTGQVEEV